MPKTDLSLKLMISYDIINNQILGINSKVVPRYDHIKFKTLILLIVGRGFLTPPNPPISWRPPLTA